MIYEIAHRTLTDFRGTPTNGAQNASIDDSRRVRGRNRKLERLVRRLPPLFGRLLYATPVRSHMTEFDAEQFEDKYANYFPELQRAYKNAFETMNDAYDSQLIHGIDQQVLNESEPFYEGDGEFRIELPEEPYDRLTAVVVDREKFETVLDRYLDEIEAELRRVFEFEG